MTDAHLPPPLRLALVGFPNCGKTALFNALTGSRQRVANYPGVTVERKEGALVTPAGRRVRVLDLPGTYSLRARSPDEAITRDVVLGRLEGEDLPDLLVCVADATNLRLNLRLAVELHQVGVPVVLALNMMDLAERRGVDIDQAALAAALGMPVVATVAVRRNGIAELLAEIDTLAGQLPPADARSDHGWREPGAEELRAHHREVERILALAIGAHGQPSAATRRLDAVLLHPVLGILALLALLFLVFQAVFAWASAPKALIDGGFSALRELMSSSMAEGPLRGLIVDGLIAGVGGVVTFLPQILILFLFILLLEDSGYLARAAFLLDRVMGGVGLHGRAFIPLLSSFACAVPGIMATRTIENPRDRLATILIAPLMTCSARLPVYTLLIGAFIPDTALAGGIGLQGVVLFGLFGLGLASALALAWVLKRTLLKGEPQPLIMELPPYRLPDPWNVALGLYERGRAFLVRAGTIIFALMVLIWFLATFPGAPEGATGPAIEYSLAGMLGHALAPLLAPVGFDWRISIALIPGMAAREVFVAAIGTVFSISGEGGAGGDALAAAMAQAWGLPTGLALLAWYVFSPQCASTLAVVRRETNSWRWTALQVVVMVTMAWLAAFATFHGARALL